MTTKKQDQRIQSIKDDIECYGDREVSNVEIKETSTKAVIVSFTYNWTNQQGNSFQVYSIGARGSEKLIGKAVN